MKKLLIVDGQGGKIGKLIIDEIKRADCKLEITAVGTNSAATAYMLKSNPDIAATGENAVKVACRTADFICGPIGIAVADSLFGEVTPAMALAVGKSNAIKILIPINKCSINIAGTDKKTLSLLVSEAVAMIVDKFLEK